MTSSYHILLTVTLLHDYFKDGRCPDFSIRPAEETAAALKGLCILWRPIGNMLALLVKVREDGSTFQPLPRDLTLRFYLELENPGFMNYTHIAFQNRSIFYFSNLYKTEADGHLFLTHPVALFVNADAYEIGQMTTSDGAVYEAIKPRVSGGPAPGNADYWHQRMGAQYVTPLDRLPLSDGQWQLSVAPAKIFELKIFTRNAATLDFDVLLSEQRQTYQEPLNNITVHLAGLPAGNYRVLVNGAEHWVYVDQTAVYTGIFGILELSNRFEPSDDAGWVDENSVPRQLDYVIRFPNRLALWKYIARSASVTGVENSVVPGQFVPALQPRQFISKVPLPLSQAPVTTLKVKVGATPLDRPLANPQADRISTYTDADNNTYYCAEMFLNY